MLFEMKTCKQKTCPTLGWVHIRVEEGQAAYTGIMPIRQQLPVEFRYLGPARHCISMSKLQVLKLLESSESVEEEGKDLINSLLKACSSSN